MNESEAHLRIGKGDTLHLADDVRQLRLVALQELAASRDIVEEIAYLEIGTHRTRDDLLPLEVATIDADADTCLVLRPARAQFDLSHSSYRRERLTTEAHGAEFEKVGS